MARCFPESGDTPTDAEIFAMMLGAKKSSYPKGKFRPLSKKVELMIREAVSSIGSYDPEETLFMFEENLTLDEAHDVNAFLSWVHSNHLHFGHGNLQEVYRRFKNQEKPPR